MNSLDNRINYTEFLINFNFLSKKQLVKSYVSLLIQDLCEKSDSQEFISKLVFLEVSEIILSINIYLVF